MGVRALVMELVDGPTLAERLEHGRLPVDESLSIARQLAEALEEADRGIVHRDLKPQNIKAAAEGEVGWPGAGATSIDLTRDFFELSPDGRGASIGLFANGELRRIAREGGQAQKLCDAPAGRGAAWGPDGTIIFSADYGTHGLSRVADRGGTLGQLARVASTPGSTGDHRYPQFLPGGRHFLFTRRRRSTSICHDRRYRVVCRNRDRQRARAAEHIRISRRRSSRSCHAS